MRVLLLGAMATLTYRTAGESHGRALITLVEGLPAGVVVDKAFIDGELRRRQGGYGRGGRQKIETDSVEILAGVRRGRTIGSPVALQIANRDFRIDDAPPVHAPRPGHADLAGSIKWLITDCRDVLERASARETAARVAAGALCRCLLREFDIDVFGYVLSIGNVRADVDFSAGLKALRAARDEGDLFKDWVACPDRQAAEAMRRLIRQAKEDGDTLGGMVEARVFGCPPGLGSCAQYDMRLDARLAMAVMGVQAFKSVEIGAGRDAALLPGSRMHDEIAYDQSQAGTPTLGFVRSGNNAGGIEGGMSNGQPIVVRGAMKPIATLGPSRSMGSVDLRTRQPQRAAYERSDVCAVPAASVIVENVVAFEIARALLEKFGGDTMAEVCHAYEGFLSAARRPPRRQ